MTMTTKEQAKDLAEQIYFATEPRDKIITKTSLDAAVKTYLGYSAQIELEQFEFNKRFRVNNLRDLLMQEGYFKACDDGMGYVMVLEKIRQGI